MRDSMQASDFSLLDQELCDEYIRNERALKAHVEYLRTECIHGYVSRKKISGKLRYYLQWREGQKIRSRYIKESDVSGVIELVAERKSHEASVRTIKRDLKRIERVLGKEMIEDYRRLMSDAGQ